MQVMLNLLLICSVSAPAPAPATVLVHDPAGGPTLRVTAAVGSSSSFRLSVEFVLDDPAIQPAITAPPLESPSLDSKRAMAVRVSCILFLLFCLTQGYCWIKNLLSD